MREWKARKARKARKVMNAECRMQDGCPEYAGQVSKMRLSGVRNGFVVVPSVPYGARNLSQSESATPMAFWTEMSKLSKMLFEN